MMPDPDPLDPRDYDRWQDWANGYHAGWDDAPRGVVYVPASRHLRVGIALAVAAAVVFGFVLGLSAGRADAAPRGARVIPADAVVAVPAATGETVEPDRELPGAPPVVPPAGGAPSPVSGVASWYATNGLVAAAGPRLRTGTWRGRLIAVTAGPRTVVVRLVDWCQCYGSRLIDLSDDAFRLLAPLERGLVRVSVVAAPGPTLPPTDKEKS